MTAAPAFRSLALEAVPDFDFADVMLVAVPAAVADRLAGDPRLAAAEIFGHRSVSGVVRVLFVVRQAFVTALRFRSSASDRRAFEVKRVEGSEALILTEQPHLTFAVGVALEEGVLRLTTSVRLIGWRGRLYFALVRPLHPLVTHAMMTKAVRRLSGA